MSKEYVVAIAGATGLVGRKMMEILEERNFPVREIKLLASERSRGKKLKFKGEEIEVRVLAPEEFKGVDFAIFSAGGSISKAIGKQVAEAGAVMIDNSSAWRMDPEVPLVVPEVNPEDAQKHKGIIANPNCSTIQMLVALKPLHDAAKIRRIVVVTYQSTSGAGKEAVEELRAHSEAMLKGEKYENKVFPHPIAFNCLPQIPQSKAFGDNFYTSEEMKMVNETRKMFHDDSIMVSATCVRVPVFGAHAEAINITTERKLSRDQAIKVLSDAPGIKVVDDPANQKYPLQLDAEGVDDVFVGRVREDISQEQGLDLWCVADNIRKGAATNAVQIAELLAAASR